MHFKPNKSALFPHIHNYWIVNNASELFGKEELYEYPGVTPEIMIVLDGHFTFEYQGKVRTVNDGVLFAFIHEKLHFDPTNLNAFIMIQFQSRGISSVRPFVQKSAAELLSNPILDLDDVFEGASGWTQNLRLASTNEQRLKLLDDFFVYHFNPDRVGLLPAITSTLKEKETLKEVLRDSPYSVSTFERHFKKETGLTPKMFMSLQRYKRVAQEICESKNDDWMYYVVKYNYFDQSHFIKEMKRFTSFTPKQLLNLPSLLDYRSLHI